MLLILAFLSCANTRPITLHSQAIEARGGVFHQAGGFLSSGGLFWAPYLELTDPFSVQGRAGTWLLKDTGGMPALSPSVQLGIRYFHSATALALTALGGGGFAFALDRAFLEAGLSLSRGFNPPLILGISEIGIQYLLIQTDLGLNFYGVHLGWRW